MNIMQINSCKVRLEVTTDDDYYFREDFSLKTNLFGDSPGIFSFRIQLIIKCFEINLISISIWVSIE